MSTLDDRDVPRHRPPRKGERLWGMSHSKLYADMARGLLEQPRSLGLRAVAWTDRQRDAYLVKLAKIERQRPEAAIAAVRAKHAARRAAEAAPPEVAAA